MRFIFAFLLCLTSQLAFANADYGREKKWADEITPSIVVGEPIYLQQKNKHKFIGIYTEAPSAKMGVIVVHGIGIHPDWGMIGTLRQRLADLGYSTLSIQMPILAVDAKPESYAATFPEAVERLRLAAASLKQKGLKRIAVVSHSMGSRMAYAYMARNPSEIIAWASLGMANELGATAAPITYGSIKVPVLDLYGANDLPIVLAGAEARRTSLKSETGSKQVIIPADHFFANHEDEMVKTVHDFLGAVK